MSRRVRSHAWVLWGSVGMAAIAALSLGVTLGFARSALTSAEALIVRGEAETLVATITGELRSGEVDQEHVTGALAAHRDDGVVYLAVLQGDTVLFESGDARLPDAGDRPGAMTVDEGRVRMVGAFPPQLPEDGSAFDPGPPPHGHGAPPPDHGPGHRGPPPDGAPAPWEDGGDPGHGPEEGHHGGMRHVVIELLPHVADDLRSDLNRTLFVGGLASVVLIAFALAWSRSLMRIESYERQTEREQRLVALGRMSSVMAHELKNPLASLKGHAQLLAESLEESPKAKQKAERVVREAERLEALTKNLLEFVRDGGLDRRRIKPAELFEEALYDLPSAQIALDLERAPAAIEVDRARLARAIHNLVDNALQANPEGERVAVTLRAEKRAVTIEVRDHGSGLGSEPIFEPFVTTRVRGTGLGLPIARRIVEQHGGTLTGSTHPEGGALFRVVLPNAAVKA